VTGSIDARALLRAALLRAIDKGEVRLGTKSAEETLKWATEATRVVYTTAQTSGSGAVVLNWEFNAEHGRNQLDQSTGGPNCTVPTTERDEFARDLTRHYRKVAKGLVQHMQRALTEVSATHVTARAECQALMALAKDEFGCGRGKPGVSLTRQLTPAGQAMARNMAAGGGGGGSSGGGASASAPCGRAPPLKANLWDLDL
jgi:uncharacterized protein with PIN domain